MNWILERAVLEPLRKLLERFLSFVPDIIAALLIFSCGIFLALIAKVFLTRLFRAINLDGLSSSAGLTDILVKGGMRENPSSLIGRLTAWLIVIVFSLLSLDSLNIEAVQQVLQKFVLYLPRVFAGALVLLIGCLLANFLSRAALIWAVNAGMHSAAVIARLTKLAIVLFAITVAMEQVGIGTQTTAIAFAIILGGVVLALAIAFGIGGTDMARKYLESRKKEEGEDEEDIHHL
jgi:hypothetical protein